MLYIREDKKKKEGYRYCMSIQRSTGRRDYLLSNKTFWNMTFLNLEVLSVNSRSHDVCCFTLQASLLFPFVSSVIHDISANYRMPIPPNSPVKHTIKEHTTEAMRFLAQFVGVDSLPFVHSCI